MVSVRRVAVAATLTVVFAAACDGNGVADDPTPTAAPPAEDIRTTTDVHAATTTTLRASGILGEREAAILAVRTIMSDVIGYPFPLTDTDIENIIVMHCEAFGKLGVSNWFDINLDFDPAERLAERWHPPYRDPVEDLRETMVFFSATLMATDAWCPEFTPEVDEWLAERWWLIHRWWYSEPLSPDT